MYTVHYRIFTQHHHTHFQLYHTTRCSLPSLIPRPKFFALKKTDGSDSKDKQNVKINFSCFVHSFVCPLAATNTKHLGLGTRPCSTTSAIMNNSVERLSIMEQAPKFCLFVSRISLLEHRVIAFKTILGSSSNLLTDYVY